MTVDFNEDVPVERKEVLLARLQEKIEKRKNAYYILLKDVREEFYMANLEDGVWKIGKV